MPTGWIGWCSPEREQRRHEPPSIRSESGAGSRPTTRTGEVFGGQQFVSLFSTAFLRNHQAVRDTAELLASNPYPMSPEAYARQADAYRHFDALDRLGAITAPTLVVVGEQDLLTPPWIAREVADAIPGARFEVIRGDGSSHLVPIERPDDFNRLVSDFLAG